jgi:hypothetical protein
VDLVDGTPVYDVKPYIPAYDTIPGACVAEWVESNLETRNDVFISDNAKTAAHKLTRQMKLFKHEPDEFLEALHQVLSVQVRSARDLKKSLSASLSHMRFDGLVACFRLPDAQRVEVDDIIADTAGEADTNTTPVINDFKHDSASTCESASTSGVLQLDATEQLL